MLGSWKLTVLLDVIEDFKRLDGLKVRRTCQLLHMAHIEKENLNKFALQ
jgi:hypothetical protein